MIYNFDDLNFKILSVDRFYHKPGSFLVKGRVFGALSLRIRGEGAFEIQGRRFVSKPGDVIFIPRDAPYNVEYTEGESIAIHFSECNYNQAENISLPSGGMAALFENLLKLYTEGCGANRIKACVYEILDEADRITSVQDREFLRIVEYVKENFTDGEFDVESICREFFISKSTLQRKFGKYMGMSPKQYILTLRTRKALNLLVSGLSVKETADACGFKDEKYFSRVIKERYGKCPSEFIKGIKI